MGWAAVTSIIQTDAPIIPRDLNHIITFHPLLVLDHSPRPVVSKSLQVASLRGLVAQSTGKRYPLYIRRSVALVHTAVLARPKHVNDGFRRLSEPPISNFIIAYTIPRVDFLIIIITEVPAHSGCEGPNPCLIRSPKVHVCGKGKRKLE